MRMRGLEPPRGWQATAALCRVVAGSVLLAAKARRADPLTRLASSLRSGTFGHGLGTGSRRNQSERVPLP
jgi:hypothetical protein